MLIIIYLRENHIFWTLSSRSRSVRCDGDFIIGIDGSKDGNWVNILGRDIVSYEGHRRWKIRVISKYTGYWVFLGPFQR